MVILLLGLLKIVNLVTKCDLEFCIYDKRATDDESVALLLGKL